ncbi:hypothetical protein VPH35_112271 [Triticum aestivum]
MLQRTPARSNRPALTDPLACASPARPPAAQHHQPGLGPWLRFRSGVVRIRSTTSVCLLRGLVLLPCRISVAGTGYAMIMTQERCLLVLEFFFCFFFDQEIGSRSAAWASRVDVV